MSQFLLKTAYIFSIGVLKIITVKCLKFLKFQCQITFDHDWSILCTKLKLGGHFDPPKIRGSFELGGHL